METAQAQTNLEIWVTCPYCKQYQERLEDLRDHLDTGELRAESCEAELTCIECRREFIVDNITY